MRGSVADDAGSAGVEEVAVGVVDGVVVVDTLVADEEVVVPELVDGLELLELLGVLEPLEVPEPLELEGVDGAVLAGGDEVVVGGCE